MLPGVIKSSKCGIRIIYRYNFATRKGVVSMEILNLVLFGCIFYLALIGIPSLCEKHGK